MFVFLFVFLCGLNQDRDQVMVNVVSEQDFNFSMFISLFVFLCGLNWGRDQVMVNLVADKHKLQLGE